MATQQIKHRYTDAVLFECEVTDEQQARGIAMRVALEKAVEAGATLAGAYLAGANLAGANLARATLAGAYLARATLAGANLARATLAGANLARATLADANLAGATLEGANLAGAALADATLADANLAGANLAGATLAGANLAGANLAGANLADANLARATLAGAKWRGGITISRAPLQISGLDWMVYILDDHMQIGCELHSLAEWREFDDARICAMDGREALRFWRAHKDALLMLAASDGRGVVKAEAEAA